QLPVSLEKSARLNSSSSLSPTLALWASLMQENLHYSTLLQEPKSR
ncbi:GTP1/OBG family protein, partial [Chlamydia psittaci 84-8471/1]